MHQLASYNDQTLVSGHNQVRVQNLIPFRPITIDWHTSKLLRWTPWSAALVSMSMYTCMTHWRTAQGTVKMSLERGCWYQSLPEHLPHLQMMLA